MSDQSRVSSPSDNDGSDSGINQQTIREMANETFGTNEKLAESIRNLTGNNPQSWDEQVAAEEEQEQQSVAGKEKKIDLAETVERKAPEIDLVEHGRQYFENYARMRPSFPSENSLVRQLNEPESLRHIKEGISGFPEDPNLTQDSIRLAQIEGNLTAVQLERKVLAQGQHILSLEKRNQALGDLLRKQGNILGRLENELVEQESKITELLRNKTDILRLLDEKISAMSDDIQKRFDSTLEIHKETPELVERLLSATQLVMSQIPDEYKTQIKDVAINTEDVSRLQEITRITSSLSTPKKKIPKKFRR